MRHDLGVDVIVITLAILAIGCIGVFLKNALIFFCGEDTNILALKIMILSLMLAISFVWFIIAFLDKHIKK